MKLHFIRKYFGANDWKNFTRNVRPKGGLLSSLSNYPGSILVTGCQRSGTTLVTRLLVQSPEINDIWVSKDDEFDAAIILSGNQQVKSQGRYCFQTTYVNDAYNEYIENKDLPFKIIWVVRNPFSVVNSMLHNWGHFALNDTFKACGDKYYKDSNRMSGLPQKRLFGPKDIEKACFSYVGKQQQLFKLIEHFTNDRLLVVNYESIIEKPQESVPTIFDFSDLSYKSDYIKLIKSSNKLRGEDKNSDVIESLCADAYKKARKLAVI